MNLTVLTTTAALAQIAPEWLDLLGRSSANEFFLTPTWLLTWWRTFGGDRGRRLCCVAFRDEGRLVGFAPLTWRRHWYRPGLPFRRIEFLGTGERMAEAICSDYLNVVAETGREEAVARALADCLHAGRLGVWDEVFLETLPGDSPMVGPLAEAFRRDRASVTVEEYDRSLLIPLPATWDAYLAQLSPSDRRLVRTSLKSFDDWAGSDWQLHFADDEASLAAGKAALLALHHQRWGSDAGTFRAPRFLAFHDTVLPALMAAGMLELAWIVVRAEPFVAIYNVRHAGKVSYYQTGRRTNVPDKVRPGITLLALLIRRAIERGDREFDFLPGVTRYKEQLATASRPIVRLRVVRPTWVESLRLWTRRWRPVVTGPVTVPESG